MTQKSVADVAKEQVIAYNEKDWDRARAALAPEVIYDEVGTHRRIKGVDDVLTAWKGWATAIPDSRATFQSEFVSGNTAVLEITWKGTHEGPLNTGDREIPPTGKKIELRAVQVVDVDNDRVRSVRQYFDMGTLLKQIGADH
ncbi:MAG TPA: ester cyclase [Thermoanaerobaculia bacterium]